MRFNIIEYQKAIEKKYSRKNVRDKIKAELIENVLCKTMLAQGTQLIIDFLNGDYYEAKNKRLAMFDRDIELTVLEIFITIMPLNDRPFVEVVGMVAKDLGMSNKVEGIKTASEFLAVLTDTGLYDLEKRMKTNDEGHKYPELWFLPQYSLSPNLLRFIEETEYLPPTIVPPDMVTKNFDYDGLTTQGSMILGKGNHHNEHLGLDSLNRFNQVALSLNTELLTEFAEQKPDEFTNEDHQTQWHNFVRRSYQIYKDLIQTGNEFYLYHKFDKRGRCYSQGYHVNTQGNEFRKAIIELKDKEVVTQ